MLLGKWIWCHGTLKQLNISQHQNGRTAVIYTKKDAYDKQVKPNGAIEVCKWHASTKECRRHIR